MSPLPRTWAILVVLSALILCCAHNPGAKSTDEPPQASLYSLILDFYRGPLNHLEAVRGGGVCPMYPSCSEYSRQAVDRHGFAVGWVMTVDRLMRCGRDEMKRAPRVRVNGAYKYLDPVEANDFWWAEPARGQAATAPVTSAAP